MTRLPLRRFSLSMPGDLVRRLDTLVRRKGYANRSQAVADMVRAQLVEHLAAAGEREITGTITLVYDHHKRNVQALLTEVQHAHPDLIVATLHVHLDHRNCMEVLAVRGPSRGVRRLADRLTAARGIQHGRLTVTTAGRDLTS